MDFRRLREDDAEYARSTIGKWTTLPGYPPVLPCPTIRVDSRRQWFQAHIRSVLDWGKDNAASMRRG